MAPPARGGGAWRCSSSLLEIARAFTAFVALAPRGAGCAVPHAPRGARGAAGGGAQLCEREAGCVRACGVRCIAECCREPACMAGEAGASEWEYPLEHGAACFQRCEDACHDEHDAGVPATPAESCMDAGTEACTAECGMPWPEDFYYAEPEPSDEDDAAMLCFHRCFANHLRSQTIVPPEDCTNCELRCSGDCLTTCEEGGASSDEALLDCTDECAQECMETCVDVVHVFVFNVDTGEVEPREVHLSGLLDDSYADDAGAEGLCEDNCQVDCEDDCGYFDASGKYIETSTPGCYDRCESRCVDRCARVGSDVHGAQSIANLSDLYEPDLDGTSDLDLGLYEHYDL